MSRSARHPSLPLTPSAMWSACVTRDPRYDGRFFTAVRTTGIYCRPTCTCRMPRRENVAFYPTAAEAARAGYRPCKRCRPELTGGPAEADRLLVGRALTLMRTRLAEPLHARDIAAALAMSASHFARRFRAVDGRTPMRALADLRAERAESLLGDRSLTTLEVAFEAGFQSASAFARAFRRRTGMAPAAWRETQTERTRGERSR